MSNRLLVAVFDEQEGLLGATRAARAEGLEIVDAYTPFAVHGLPEAMGLKPSRLPWVCFFLGLSGAAAKLWFQIWAMGSSWPVNVGGKPFVAVPAYVPVTFEVTVLFAGLGTVAALLLRSRLFPSRRPRLAAPSVTDDKFALVLRERGADFGPEEARRLFGPFSPAAIEEALEEDSP